MKTDKTSIIDILKSLYPMRRDLISDGYDAAISILQKYYPLKIHSYESGKKCWTWRIPFKWTLRDAYIADLEDNTIFDMNTSPLFVSSYSNPVNITLPINSLKEHIHTHREKNYTPYSYNYYNDKFSFNLSESQLQLLNKTSYKVFIDSIFTDDFLKVAEWEIRGKTNKVFVIATHIDHAYQANDGLSGVLTGLAVMDKLAQTSNEYTYKLLILPETIGSIAWLSDHEDELHNIVGGIFLDMTASPLPPYLQYSYTMNTAIDRSIAYGFSQNAPDGNMAKYRELPGNDERQFNAPGVRIPMLAYARILPQGHLDYPFKQYHTIEDNIENLSYESLFESARIIYDTIMIFDEDIIPLNLYKGEVFLSGLDFGITRIDVKNDYHNLMKIMDMIDGKNLLSDIATKIKVPFTLVKSFVNLLISNNLAKKVYPNSQGDDE